MSDLKKYIAGTPMRVNQVQHQGSLPKIIERTIQILDQQVEKLYLLSARASFTAEEAKILQSYIKSIIDLSKEEREANAKDQLAKQLANMSDEELLAAFQEQRTKTLESHKTK